MSNSLKETDNYVEKYLPFKVSNLIADILKPITDERGPFANLIPNETAMKNKILYHILNDDGEPTLDKEGNEIKRLNKDFKRQNSPDITSPGRGSEVSIPQNYSSPRDPDLKISPQKMQSEESEDASPHSRPNVEVKEVPRDSMSYIGDSPIAVRSPLRSATVIKQIPLNFRQTEEDSRFFSQSEKLLKVRNYVVI